MGLDISHDCWHGAYSAFMRWREKITEIAGLPPLNLMEGFYASDHYMNPIYWAKQSNCAKGSFDDMERQLPIKWACLKPDILYELLYHSDCDGELSVEICKKLYPRLEEILKLMPSGDGGGHIGNWKDKTQQFIDGLKEAVSRNEIVTFR